MLGYDDPETAKNAYHEELELQRDFVVDLTGLGVVTVDADGQRPVDTPGEVAGASAVSGAFWGPGEVVT